MTRELVDYRVQQCRARASAEPAGNTFSCTVTWNKRDPILKLPDRNKAPDLPHGDVDVRLPDGAVWTFRFASQFCNVARPAAADRNRLPALMRSWFGPSAGQPGTRFQAQFSRSPDGWWVAPLGRAPVATTRGRLVAYPSLRAAAGAIGGARSDTPEPELVILPFDGDSDDVFAVRAAGDSMNGGKTPISDGDWLIMRWARGASLSALAGRVALIQTADGHDTFAYQVKRIVHDGDRWWLRSDNPDHAPVEATVDTIPIARLVTRITPETLAPAVGEWRTLDTLAAAFGLPAETTIERTGRHAGHLFILANELGLFTEPDRLTTLVGDRRPAETAFVLARPTAKGSWRYCGIGRWLETEQQWRVPPLDFDTWLALGRGRNCSRRLPDEAKTRAQAFVDELFRRTGAGAWLTHNGKRCRVLERTTGGVRIDGGEDGFVPRRVSVTDIAWVLLAADDVAANGGVLDEARVNRLRYLEGTPKGSTRWIDTRWAIAMVVGMTGRDAG